MDSSNPAAPAVYRAPYRTLEYRAQASRAVAVYANGEADPVRVAVRPAGSARAAQALARLLNAALREGAAYGPEDVTREIGDALAGRHTPGRVRYELEPGWTILRRANGSAAAVDVPRLQSRGAMVELALELEVAFQLGGQFPAAVPAAPAGVPDPAPALAARLAALREGQVLLELASGSVVHLAVETPGVGVLCGCGKAGLTRFAVARLHTRTRNMPRVRELGVGTRPCTDRA